MNSRNARKLYPFILLAAILAGCGQPFAIATPTATATLEPTGTTAPILLPGAQDTVLLSLEENGHAHLFLYIPQKLPLTRLTHGEWDDTSPALL